MTENSFLSSCDREDLQLQNMMLEYPKDCFWREILAVSLALKKELDFSNALLKGTFIALT